MQIEKFSFGIGDRFAHQGKAQLQAFVMAKKAGVNIVPVWNKSHREHTTIGSEPPAVRTESDEAVAALSWTDSYYVDADHIGLGNVDLFMDSSDFFTLDVAHFIGKEADADAINAFVKKQSKYVGSHSIPGIDEPLEITLSQIEKTTKLFLNGMIEAGKVYRHIEAAKGKDNFVTEVSIDETDNPQSPVELLFILAVIADQNIPVQTIAPKFTGRFNKGVDYVGNIKQFTKEFEQDLAVIAFAVKEFGLPENLKLSVHSGSDKFAIYKPIREALAKTGAGLHIKTAGTTWLEELIGLAEAGGEGLRVAQDIYRQAFENCEALCEPYATVIDIDPARLPSPDEVDLWGSEKYVTTLRHDQSNVNYNQHFRQLLHVGYKIAAKLGDRYLNALNDCEKSVARNVTENLFERHIKPLFL